MKFLQNKKRIYLYLGIGLLLLCLIMVPIGTTLAKYVSTLTPEQPYVPTGFYFTSNLLTEEGKEYTLRNDVNSITVTLRNYADDLRVSGVDYDYTVTITKNGGNFEPQTQSGSFNVELVDDKPRKKTADITFNGLGLGTYTITATTEQPYAETLTATFDINTESETLDSSYVDAGPVVYLTITSEAYEGNVRIDVPDGLIPDNTDYARFNTATVTEDVVTFPMEKYSTIKLTFFKEDPNADFEGSLTVAKVN